MNQQCNSQLFRLCINQTKWFYVIAGVFLYVACWEWWGWSCLWVIPGRACISIRLYQVTLVIWYFMYSAMFSLRLSVFYHIIISIFLSLFFYLCKHSPIFPALSVHHLSTHLISTLIWLLLLIPDSFVHFGTYSSACFLFVGFVYSSINCIYSFSSFLFSSSIYFTYSFACKFVYFISFISLIYGVISFRVAF